MGQDEPKVTPTKKNLGDFLRQIKAVTMVAQPQKTHSELENRGNQKGEDRECGDQGRECRLH